MGKEVPSHLLFTGTFFQSNILKQPTGLKQLQTTKQTHSEAN